MPYWVYQDEPNYKREMRQIFEAATWNYLCLEADLPNSGSYRTTLAGETPVVVVRDADGAINAFENRCAHRGALIALEKAGRARNFQCVYHAWSYNRQGDLTGVAFEKGVKGQGGMPPDFRKEAPRPAQAARRRPSAAWSSAASARTSPSSRPIWASEVVRGIERVLTGRSR